MKCWPSHFEAVVKRKKRFEVRINDRDYAEGDLLVLREWDPAPGMFVNDVPKPKGYTGRKATCLITYVLHGGQFGVEQGCVVLSINPRSLG
jgi:hypothetical protein